MLAPFFECSFGLLRFGGELGFIVSNAFAKRDFGKPLVEQFFSQIDLQKVVDCSGLLFPGHGTPTCIILGSNRRPRPDSEVRFVGILPGGGDLRTPPEESLLWLTIAEHHDLPGYNDQRIAVADRTQQEVARFPWSFDIGSQNLQTEIERAGPRQITEFVDSIGICFFTNAEEVFQLRPDVARRLGLNLELLECCQKGEDIRNWSMSSDVLSLRPYDADWVPIKLKEFPAVAQYLRAFRKPLGNRATFSGKTYDEEGKLWYGYHIINYKKLDKTTIISFSFIATHNHFVLEHGRRLYRQTAPIIVLRAALHAQLLTGLLNSSAALFWLKQVCFNKGAGEDEERDRFEFQGNKVEQLPVPAVFAAGFDGNPNGVVEQLGLLSQSCWQCGGALPGFALQKLFEKRTEAYSDWNNVLPCYIGPGSNSGGAFDSTESLRSAYKHLQAVREEVRAKMIALQEEMDWLTYAAYSLLPGEHAAVQVELEPSPLDREQRPFRLWARAGGDFALATRLIPDGWTEHKRKLWEARLSAIRDNDHIRRIEQPAYKRRWEEQWKVGNQWGCGSTAYATEFVEAFEWWVCEKAEWWLEMTKAGGPVDFDEWVDAIWNDTRVKSAWPVAAEEYARLEYEKASERAEKNGDPSPALAPRLTDRASFAQKFREIVDKETVPEGFPFATPYEELEKNVKKSVPAKLRKVRGRLNAPRERFHLRGRAQFLWAGLQFK